MNKILNTVIRLRRDTLANYEFIANTFIPASGEVCIVETSEGTNFKIGDGNHYFSQLAYVKDFSNSAIARGYYFNNKFYSDSTYTTELEKKLTTLYIDKIVSGELYSWNGTSFERVIPNASDTVAGIMKLYKVSGQNEDGTMTQKAITDGVSDIKFAVDNSDNECLVLDLPW